MFSCFQCCQPEPIGSAEPLEPSPGGGKRSSSAFKQFIQTADRKAPVTMRLLENEELGHSVEAADWETKYKKKTIDEIRTDLRKAYDESQDTSVMTKAEKVERAKRKHAFLAKKLVLVEEQEEFKHEAQACDTGDLEHMSNSLQAELNHAMRNIKEMVNEVTHARSRAHISPPRWRPLFDAVRSF